MYHDLYKSENINNTLENKKLKQKRIYVAVTEGFPFNNYI